MGEVMAGLRAQQMAMQLVDWSEKKLDAYWVAMLVAERVVKKVPKMVELLAD